MAMIIAAHRSTLQKKWYHHIALNLEVVYMCSWSMKKHFSKIYRSIYIYIYIYIYIVIIGSNLHGNVYFGNKMEWDICMQFSFLEQI